MLNAENIIKIFNTLQPWLILSLCLSFAVLKWFFNGIKVEHLLQRTLNNRIRFIKQELKDGCLDAAHHEEWQRRYQQLLDEKEYGIKNPLLQREVVNILRHSPDISNPTFFAAHQHILSLNDRQQVFIDPQKVAERIKEGAALLTVSVVVMIVGLLLIKAGGLPGIIFLVLGLLIYFPGLMHFPPNRGTKKRLQHEIDRFYSRTDHATPAAQPAAESS